MQTSTQRAAARQSLIEPWQTHLRFNGREPRTLHELGIAQADYAHRQRRAELKTSAKKLEQIDALLPLLDAQGIKLAGRDFGSYDGGKSITLHIYRTPDDKLHQALLTLGFRELARKEIYAGARTDRVTLKHGRSLVLNLEVSKLPVAQPQATEVVA